MASAPNCTRSVVLFDASPRPPHSVLIQQIDSQTYRQGLKRVVDGYARWRIRPEPSLRLSMANASARGYETGTNRCCAAGANATSLRKRPETTAFIEAVMMLASIPTPNSGRASPTRISR